MFAIERVFHKIVWEVTHLRIKGSAPSPGGGGSPEKRGGGERRGEGRHFCCDSRWEFEDFSRLLDDYLDLHLFGLTAVVTGRLSRARKGVCGKGTVEGVQGAPGSYPPGGLSRWPGPNKSQPDSKQTGVL